MLLVGSLSAPPGWQPGLFTQGPRSIITDDGAPRPPPTPTQEDGKPAHLPPAQSSTSIAVSSVCVCMCERV